MSFEVIWFDFAESQLDDIYQYYTANVSLKVGKNIL
ncbi:plasmid stabilization system protein ParE [Flavobacterium sp. PL11]|jgi:toxin ParE1/3/4|nr:plasmid stabilization system protein ParE [Flavobacterium sp. PL11]